VNCRVARPAALRPARQRLAASRPWPATPRVTAGR